MESLKELLTPSRFSLFGYVAAVLYLLSGLILFGIVVNLRTIERGNFRCDVPDSLENKNTLPLQCFDDYEQQFNSPLPLYGFVLLSFLFPVVICIVYSWCCVKTQVERIEAHLVINVEAPRSRPIIETRRVFWSYLLQLLVRVVLGVSFAPLQKLVLYPSVSPTGFFCDTLSISVANATDNASTSALTDAFRINCHNSVGSEKTVWAEVVWIVNIAFTFFFLGELIYLTVRAWKRKELMFDLEFCQKYLFNKDNSLLPSFLNRRRNRVHPNREFVELEAMIARSPGEQADARLLDDMYVNLIIHSGRAAHDFKSTMERHEILSSEYVKPEHGSVSITKPEHLFLPNKDARDPRNILIIGRPGIGKSLLCNKLMVRSWARDEMSREINKSFEMAFLFKFRWFNSERTENLSLQEFLSRAASSDGNVDMNRFQYALDNPDKVLLVFDGFDEFKYHKSCLEDERAECENGPADVIRTSALYVKLVKGKLLPGATVVTTCRPNVMESLAGLTFDRTVEIMGFTQEKVHEYVGNFCKDEPDAVKQAMSKHITSNLSLLSLCYIPATCYIVCNILQKFIQLQGSGTIVLPTTLTEVYQIALAVFIWKHHPEYRDKVLTMKDLSSNARFSDTVEETLDRLGSLARDGTDERRLIFREEEVRGMEDCGLLNRMPDTETTPFAVEEHFCFIHLTLQEFLAARHIVKINPDKVSGFISSNAADPKWHLVIQFVAGRLRDQQNNKAVKKIVKLLQDSLSLFKLNKTKALLMMKSLFELNDDTTANTAATQLQASTFNNTVDFGDCHITATDCTAVVYFLKYLELLKELNLESNPSIGDVGCKEIAKLLREGVPEQLNLSSCNITNQGVLELCEALEHQHCELSNLNLGFNAQITDNSVSVLCEALKHHHCKLSKLNLSRCTITENGVSVVCEALKHQNCKLTQLDLGSEKITDKGVSHLCEALKHQNCKLAKLGFCHMVITDNGVSHLCEAARHENFKLIQLNFYFCQPNVQRKQKLKNAFANTGCHLSYIR